MASTDATFGEEPAEITRESDAFEQWLAAENRGNERLNSRTVETGDLIDIAVPEYVADAAETDVSYLLNAEVTGIWGRWDEDDTATDIKFQCGDWRGTVYTDRTHWKVSFSHTDADYIPDGNFDGGWFVESAESEESAESMYETAKSAETGEFVVVHTADGGEIDMVPHTIEESDTDRCVFLWDTDPMGHQSAAFVRANADTGRVEYYLPGDHTQHGNEVQGEVSRLEIESAESDDSDPEIVTDGGFESGPIPMSDLCDVCGIETDGDVCDGCEKSLMPFAEVQNTDGRAYTVTAVSDETHLNERIVRIDCDSGQSYVFRMLPGDRSPRFDRRENADGSTDSSVSSYPQNVENVRDAVFADDTDESHNSAAIKFARNRIESEESAETPAETTISDVIDRITQRNKAEYDSLESKAVGRFGRPDNPVRSDEERKRVSRVTRRSIENSRQPDLGAKALGAFLSQSADGATYDTADGRKVVCDGGMAVESAETDTSETDTADGPISSAAMAEILGDFDSVRNAGIDTQDVGIWVFGHEDSMLYSRVFDAIRRNGWKVEWVSASYNESPYCKVTPDR